MGLLDVFKNLDLKDKPAQIWDIVDDPLKGVLEGLNRPAGATRGALASLFDSTPNNGIDNIIAGWKNPNKFQPNVQTPLPSPVNKAIDIGVQAATDPLTYLPLAGLGAKAPRLIKPLLTPIVENQTFGRTLASEVGLNAAARAGSEVGANVGQKVGGQTGANIGSIAGGLVGGGLAVRRLTSKPANMTEMDWEEYLKQNPPETARPATLEDLTTQDIQHVADTIPPTVTKWGVVNNREDFNLDTLHDSWFTWNSPKDAQDYWGESLTGFSDGQPPTLKLVSKEFPNPESPEYVYKERDIPIEVSPGTKTIERGQLVFADKEYQRWQADPVLQKNNQIQSSLGTVAGRLGDDRLSTLAHDWEGNFTENIRKSFLEADQDAKDLYGLGTEVRNAFHEANPDGYVTLYRGENNYYGKGFDVGKDGKILSQYAEGQVLESYSTDPIAAKGFAAPSDVGSSASPDRIVMKVRVPIDDVVFAPRDAFPSEHEVVVMNRKAMANKTYEEITGIYPLSEKHQVWQVFNPVSGKVVQEFPSEDEAIRFIDSQQATAQPFPQATWDQLEARRQEINKELFDFSKPFSQDLQNEYDNILNQMEQIKSQPTIQQSKNYYLAWKDSGQIAVTSPFKTAEEAQQYAKGFGSQQQENMYIQAKPVQTTTNSLDYRAVTKGVDKLPNETPLLQRGGLPEAPSYLESIDNLVPIDQTTVGKGNDFADAVTGAPKDDKLNTLQPDRVILTGTDNWQKVGGQLGSNEGGIYINSSTGQKVYAKFYGQIGQEQSEIAAQKVYNALGIPTPKGTITTIDGKTALVSPWKEGLTQLSGPELNAALKANPAQAARIHIASVLTQNWDVAGLGFDNLVRDAQGNLVLVDTGGSFTYRAQGDYKPYTLDAKEFDSLLDPSINPQSAQAFKDIYQYKSAQDAAKQAAEYVRNNASQFEAPSVSAADIRDKAKAVRVKLNGIAKPLVDDTQNITKGEIYGAGLTSKQRQELFAQGYSTGGGTLTPTQFDNLINKFGYDKKVAQQLDALSPKDRADLAEVMVNNIGAQGTDAEFMRLVINGYQKSGVTDAAKIARLNNMLRGMWATADSSWFGIQGLLTIPRLLVKGDFKDAWDVLTVPMLTLVNNKNALGKYIRRTMDSLPADAPTLREAVEQGNLHLAFLKGNVDFDFRVLDKLLPFFKPDEAFVAAGDVARTSMFYNEWRRYGAGLTGEARTKAIQDIAAAVNRATGIAEHPFGGQIGSFALFAPRFFQSQLETITKAFTDGSLEGTLARRQLLALVGTGVTMTMVANYVRGEETTLDPRDPNFMRIRNIAGNDVSVFGPWDSLAKLIVHIGSGDPGYARTKFGPLLTTAINLINKQDFLGQPIESNPYKIAQDMGQQAKEVAQGDFNITDLNPASRNTIKSLFLPFAWQEVGKENIVGGALNFFGVKNSPLSASERIDLNMQNLGLNPNDPLDRRQYIADHPEDKPQYSKIDKQADGYRQNATDSRKLNDDGLLNDSIKLVDWRENRKTVSRTLMDKLSVLYEGSDFKSDTPQKRLVDSYYALYQQAQDPITHDIDSQKFDQLQARWLETHSTQDYDYVQRYLQIGKSDVELQYLNDMQQLDKLGYFGLKKYDDTVYQMTGQLTDDEIQNYRDQVSAARSVNPELAAMSFRNAMYELLGDQLTPDQIYGLDLAGKKSYQNIAIDDMKAQYPQLFQWFNPNATWSTYQTAKGDAAAVPTYYAVPTLSQIGR